MMSNKTKNMTTLRIITCFVLLTLGTVTVRAQGDYNDSTTIIYETTAITEVETTSEPQTTTGTPAPTTTAKPDPPKKGEWNVTDEGGNVCIRLNLAASFNISYMNTDKKNVSVEINLPSDASVSGDCGNKTEQITLKFLDDWSLMFSFVKDDSNVMVDNIVIKYDTSNAAFVDVDVKEIRQANYSEPMYSVTEGNSYSCVTNQDIVMKSVVMKTSELQIQGFMTKDDFGSAQQCPADTDTSNIVPIVVGAALAALVVIVLIAYLISRNRSQAGYESV